MHVILFNIYEDIYIEYNITKLGQILNQIKKIKEQKYRRKYKVEWYDNFYFRFHKISSCNDASKNLKNGDLYITFLFKLYAHNTCMKKIARFKKPIFHILPFW